MRILWLSSFTRVGLVMASLFLLGSIGCDNAGRGPAASSNVATGESGPASSASASPNTSFTTQLGISGGPVSAEDARQIAELATGGTALSVEEEDEDGSPVFGVTVEVGSARKDVKVRISDGAVIKIEDDGEDPDDGEQDEEEEERDADEGESR